jgi:uncharacterized protein YbaR (Trm112 family)
MALKSAGRIALVVTDDVGAADKVRDRSVVDSGATAAALESWVTELLACPMDRGAVRLDEGVLVCDLCGRRYSLRSGIPRMLPVQPSEEQEF